MVAVICSFGSELDMMLSKYDKYDQAAQGSKGRSMVGRIPPGNSSAQTSEMLRDLSQR